MDARNKSLLILSIFQFSQDCTTAMSQTVQYTQHNKMTFSKNVNAIYLLQICINTNEKTIVFLNPTYPLLLSLPPIFYFHLFHSTCSVLPSSYKIYKYFSDTNLYNFKLRVQFVNVATRLIYTR